MRGRYFFGIILILLGTGLLMDQMGYIDFGEILGIYWPLILIFLGISGLFDKNNSKLGSLILIAIGLMFQLNRLGIVDVNVFRLFWPIVLILVGINIIFTKGIRKHPSPVEPEKWSDENINMEDAIDLFVLFSGTTAINQSSQFKGGKATALFGGIDLDLRNAQLKDNRAFLEITSLFAGIEVKVPDHWRVEVQATPVFGGLDNTARSSTDPSAPTLKISGTVVFGGIDIKN